ncbi:hypothetical protein LSAT2_025858 [Lamellibrachia satsuma]|nr:hypothetical protein LSAT2_025858 [Lamellibrachia satsuma]
MFKLEKVGQVGKEVDGRQSIFKQEKVGQVGKEMDGRQSIFKQEKVEHVGKEVGGRQSIFKLEKVGQYLKYEELHDPPDGSTNPWVDFLEQNPKLQESSLLYRACPAKSLVQMHDSLKASVDVTVQHSASVIGQSLQCVSTSHLFTLSQR